MTKEQEEQAYRDWYVVYAEEVRSRVRAWRPRPMVDANPDDTESGVE